MPDPVRWGPENPHPLSQMRTELVWDGKYDEYGRRRSVDVAGAAMPMQKIETVDMPRSEALASGQTTLGELSTIPCRKTIAVICIDLLHSASLLF